MKFHLHLFYMVSASFLMISSAHAFATHTAQVEIGLLQVDGAGREHSLEDTVGDFFLDWNTKKCEIQLKKQKFVYCSLNTSQDITNSKHELVMKAMPQAHFEASVIDALIRSVGLENRSTKNLIEKILKDTSTSRSKGFDLPFYTCGDCEKNGKDLILWNAYHSYVIRDLSIQHPYLGNKKLVLRMKIKEMKAVRGGFNIIGNSNAANYGH